MLGGLNKKFARLYPQLFLLAALFFVFTPAHAQDFTTGLVGHWKMDEAAGTSVLDSSPSSFNGTFINTPVWQSAGGHIDGALEFVAASATGVALPNGAFASLTAGTIAAWVNWNGTAGVQQVFLQGGFPQWFEFFVNNGRIEIWSAATCSPRIIGHTGASIITAGTWHHIAYATNGSGNSFYIDGVPVSVTYSSGNATTNSFFNQCGAVAGTGYRIGRATSATEYFDGDIDEARIYNRRLTDADIAALYAYTGGDLPCNAAHAGVMLYNTDEHVLQYCNSTDWIDAGPKAPLTTSADCTGLGASHYNDPVGGHCYYVGSASANWATARTNCSAAGDYLANVNSLAEDTMLRTNVVPADLNNTAAVWVGASDSGVEGEWRWVDGDLNGQQFWQGDVSGSAQNGLYSGNFGTGQPDNSGSSEHYMGYFDFNNDQSNVWNDFPDGSHRYICEREGVAVAGTCSSPDGVEGEVDYNYTHAVMQYCNGSDWINMGPIVSGSAPAAPTTGLVAHWKLDETTGSTTAADSAGSNTGTLVNMDPNTDWVAGKNGGALEFLRTSSQRVDTGFNSTLNDFTVCAWFNSSSATGGQSIRLVDKDYQNGFWLGRRMTGVSDWGGGIRESSSPYGIYVALADNQWNHLCMTRLGTTQTIYGNGGAVTNTQAVTATAVDSSPVRLGAGEGLDPNDFLTGSLDDVRIYNVALTAQQVEDLYLATGGSASIPSSCPNAGDECTDGTFYAGLSPDGNVKMYATPCDRGQTWNGTVCTGTSTGLPWNNGTVGNYTDFAASSPTDGDANTTALLTFDSDSVTGGVQAHQAAAYCDSLSANGHDDWYLPSRDELHLFYNGGTPIANVLGASTYYWSSSQWGGNTTAGMESFSPLDQSSGGKAGAYKIRCVRKGPPPSLGSCSSPNGVAGEMVYNADNDLLQYCNGSDWVGVR